MDKTKLQSHLTRLQERHADIDKAIAKGYTNYISDDNLGKMKQERLYVKRQIEEVTLQLENING